MLSSLTEKLFAAIPDVFACVCVYIDTWFLWRYVCLSFVFHAVDNKRGLFKITHRILYTSEYRIHTPDMNIEHTHIPIFEKKQLSARKFFDSFTVLFRWFCVYALFFVKIFCNNNKFAKNFMYLFLLFDVVVRCCCCCYCVLTLLLDFDVI